MKFRCIKYIALHDPTFQLLIEGYPDAQAKNATVYNKILSSRILEESLPFLIFNRISHSDTILPNLNE
jgi:hypothetical protein